MIKNNCLRVFIFLGLFVLAIPSFAETESLLKQSGSHWVGPDEAPVKIVVYYNYTCPHCKTFFNDIYPNIQKKYIDKGDVQIRFIVIPPDKLSLFTATIVNCLDREFFMDITNVIFSTQDDWIMADDPFASMRNIFLLNGLNKEVLNTCEVNKNIKSALAKNTHYHLKKIGKAVVPYILINDKPMKDGVRISQIYDEIEKAIKDVKNKGKEDVSK